MARPPPSPTPNDRDNNCACAARLLVTFVGVAFLTTGPSTALLFALAHRTSVPTSASIATTAAALINGDPQMQVRTRADESSPEYMKLRDELRRVRDANRRDDTYVKFAYTIFPRPDRPGTFQFGVDPEEDHDDQSHVIRHPRRFARACRRSNRATTVFYTIATPEVPTAV